MAPFIAAHATHPDWRGALALVLAQVQAQRTAGAPAPTLGWVYLTDRYGPDAAALLAELRRALPGVGWVGGVGVGIAASGVEYFDEPGLAVLLAALPREHFRIWSGQRPLRDFAAHTAMVHADPVTPDVDALVADLAERTATGYLFGGLVSARTGTLHIADEVLQGGLSGVAFDAEVELVSRVTQGCQPIGTARRITASDRNVITALDGQPALDCLLADLGLAGTDPRRAVETLRQTLVGLTDPLVAAASPARHGSFGADTLVRHLVGLDPGRRGVAIGDEAPLGHQLAFCRRDVEAARRDLRRICAEIREEVEPEQLEPVTALARKVAGEAGDASGVPGIAGAIYVSCAGRGGPHFGGPSAELQIVRHALGDVPLVGFFAAGEIARHHLYGYTGVLTVFRG